MHFAAVGPALTVASVYKFDHLLIHDSTSQLFSAKLAARPGAESWCTLSLRAVEENVNEMDAVMHPT